MPSVETKIWLALKSRLDGLASLVNMQVAWPNENFTPAPAGYLRISHVPNTPERLFQGSDEPHERMGIVQVMVMKPRNQPVAVITDVAGRIAAHFPDDYPMRYDGVAVRVRRRPFVGQAVPGDAYAELAVNIEYRSFS